MKKAYTQNYLSSHLTETCQAIFATDCQNETLLHLAAAKGNDALCRFLIEQGLDINAKGDQNKTPLHYAVQYGHSTVVAMLCGLYADIDAQQTVVITHR